ncbi:hypothetical protein BOTBODRAFT_41257 [Botryobasidium botryosum FD-172 SS1]|uniref:Uncharacterized protein n=1 Tax=Botryobasidium botryosum (strain FD-172 SS1) TaxID=930990 RepID=A0A067N778_BOTB1|nr:hypothetical protein BOTBODRAFT_41257 [Botryobasidium botryosum FD-172 SS1]
MRVLGAASVPTKTALKHPGPCDSANSHMRREYIAEKGLAAVLSIARPYGQHCSGVWSRLLLSRLRSQTSRKLRYAPLNEHPLSDKPEPLDLERGGCAKRSNTQYPKIISSAGLPFLNDASLRSAICADQREVTDKETASPEGQPASMLQKIIKEGAKKLATRLVVPHGLERLADEFQGKVGGKEGGMPSRREDARTGKDRRVVQRRPKQLFDNELPSAKAKYIELQGPVPAAWHRIYEAQARRSNATLQSNLLGTWYWAGRRLLVKERNTARLRKAPAATAVPLKKIKRRWQKTR